MRACPISTKVADLPRKAWLAADYIAILRIVQSLVARSLLLARSRFCWKDEI